MVKTTETYVVACTVTADNPLAAFCQVMAEIYDCRASLALVGILLCLFCKLITEIMRELGVISVLILCLCRRTQSLGCILICFELHTDILKTRTHLFISEIHAETKLAEVFEE